MAIDKHSQDALAKLYAEWISAGMKMSLAGFTASLKILEATGQSVTSARAKANEAIEAREAQSEAKPASAAQPTQPAQAAKPVVASKPAAEAETVVAMKPKLVEPAAAPKPQANAKVDDLKLISGIGPKLEQMLLGRGITSFAAIAALN
ncbi:MAG: 5' DNA nuclease, partial [Rhizobiaceae bacterium]